MKRYTSSVAVAALVLAGSVAATAQDASQAQSVPAAAAPASGQPEEIVVTGSRIKRTDLVSQSPISFVGADEIAKTATVNAEDVIRELPQALPGISAGVNNGNPGVATVNLRALDDERTLVLVNGKRMVGYDSEGIVDINNIPTPLIERIDVVTGGASAVYGSDAIAGVVNFVLKDDFEGVQLDYNYANALRGGEATNNFDAVIGVNSGDERGNVTVYAGWTERDPITQGDRWFSERQIATADGSFGGSSTDTNGNIICGGCSWAGGGATPNFGPQTFVGFGSANGDLIPRGSRRFNFNPYNLLQVPQTRYQATALGHYDLADWATAYAEINFSQTQVDSVIAPSGTFFNEYDIPFDSVFLTSQARSVLFGDVNGTGNYDPSFDTNGDGNVGPGDFAHYAFGRRTVEVGPRITRNRTQAWQIVAGLKGDITPLDGWSYDFSAQHGRTELSRIFQNDLNNNRIKDVIASSSASAQDLDDDGLLNGSQTAVDGGPCLSSASAGCVVGSFFGDGSLNSGAAGYIALNLSENVFVEQDVVHFDMGGDFGETFKIPGASAIAANFGAEWRRVRTESFPDDCYKTPDCSPGFGSTSPVNGGFNVKEIFAELDVPLVEDKPFIKSLVLNGAYRWADYSHTGTASAYKAGGEYRPIEDFLFRVVYQRAVRAPNVFEFLQPITSGLDNSVGDPCAAWNEALGTSTIDQRLRDLCVQTGVDPSLLVETAPGSGIYTTSVPDVISGQINQFGGGSTTLKEEVARTLTVGGVYQPKFLEGLNITVDWYRVEIENPISELLADTVLKGCYSAAQNPTNDPNKLECTLIQRNAGNGGLVGQSTINGTRVGINEIERNIGSLKVEGLDMSADYTVDAGNFGNVDLTFAATKVFTNDNKPTKTSPTIHCNGKYGPVCLAPNPSLRFTQTTTWNIGDFSIGYRWRYLRSTKFESPTLDANEDGVVDANLCAKKFCQVPDTHYVDLIIGWTPTSVDWLTGFEFQVGLENMFDQDPRIVGADAGPTDQNSGNTFPGTFDTAGRTLTLRASKKF